MLNIGSTFKRDQVERTIARLCGSRDDGGSPTPTLRADIRRLLQVDRQAEIKNAPGSPGSYAFYAAAPPGKGYEIGWSAYDAFALLIAVRLLHAEFPQGAAVEFLRRARIPLSREFADILSTPPEARRGDLENNSEAVISDLRSGFLVRKPEKMVFLVIEAAELRPASVIEEGSELVLLNIRRGTHDLLGSFVEFSHRGAIATVVELVNTAYQLVFWLNHFPPPRRGRP